MREHIYKAKTFDGKYVFGYYVKAEKLDGIGYEHFIVEESKDGSTYNIVPETLCEYTNRKDIHGKPIFENDIVRTKYGRICRVCWVSVGGYCGFDLDPLEAEHKAPTEYDLYDNLEVIGEDKKNDFCFCVANKH